ncbi:hypothetical protein DYB37_009334 [Aphanomyces astaci]|uniref:Aspartate--tRNA ligase n=2 Tax=Aphanomyces astaci TaxID=112090 RepID=A0A3R7FAS0_APHAT|nr:hypothetical protein DYB37_009334 [Aphanomyces astaci]
MDAATLEAAIVAKGNEIRELKAAKADVTAQVADLKKLKADYKFAAGHEFGASAAAAAPKEKQLTKKELRILEKQKAAEAAAAIKTDSADPSKFGDAPLIQSRELPTKTFVDVANIDKSLAGQSFWVRGYLQNCRAKPKIAFLIVRQGAFTIQAVVTESADVSKALIKYASDIPRESVVDVFVTVIVPVNPITGTTQHDAELSVAKIFTISKALPVLPLQVEDASRSDTLVFAEGSDYVEVGLDTRLDNRVLDLRTPANQAIMRIQSGVGQLFREFLYSKGFVEIHTPKLLGGASEGGANCFSFGYFGESAVLAQSPQLHKQMACACAGLEKVFEIGPVFRAENSLTARHLCEFTGLDLEMAIKEHYSEHPFEPLKYRNPTLVLKFDEAVAMLQEAGIDQDLLEDLSNSYDFMIRGQEILSGAQRVHDPALLVKRMESLGVPETELQTYVDAFKFGALPHAGGGVGLERVVMLFLGLGNIRKASMFPRDPSDTVPPSMLSPTSSSNDSIDDDIVDVGDGVELAPVHDDVRDDIICAIFNLPNSTIFYQAPPASTSADQPPPSSSNSVATSPLTPDEHQHPFMDVAHDTFAISSDEFVDLFLSERAIYGIAEANRRRGATDIVCGEWTPDQDGRVDDRMIMTWSTPSSCDVVMQLRVVFVKSTLWRSLIESRAKAECKQKSVEWLELAKAAVSPAGLPAYPASLDPVPTEGAASPRTHKRVRAASATTSPFAKDTRQRLPAAEATGVAALEPLKPTRHRPTGGRRRRLASIGTNCCACMARLEMLNGH